MRQLLIFLFLLPLVVNAQMRAVTSTLRTSNAVAAQDSVPYIIIDDYTIGDGTDGYEHVYTGAWSSNSTSPSWYAETQHCCGPTDGTIVLKFNGTKIQWWTERAPHLGIAAVKIDAGAETNVDLYNAVQAQQIKVWDSGTLSQAEHTVTIRVTGTKNASSSGTYIVHDFLKVYNNQDVVPIPGVDEADRYIATTGTDTGNCSNSASPCLTFVYTMTQAVSGDLVQAAAGTYVENNYISVPTNVDIRGAGIDLTIVRGASGLWDDFDDFDYEWDKSLFQYVSGSETQGDQYIKDLTIDGQGTAYNDGTGPTHSTLLNDRGMYGGVYIRYRNDVTVDGIKVRKCFFDAVMVFNTRDSKILNSTFIDNAYGQSAFASGNVMWGGDYNSNLEISGCTVNEGFGNGMKAFAGQPSQGTVTFNVYGNNISVTPTGQWAGGGAPNIAFENWGVEMANCELHDNYLDANISLVNNDQDDDGVPTIRVYNNEMDMITRAAGDGYPLELSVSYAEVDHNYFIGGENASISNYQSAIYPTLATKYTDWEIHHNVFIAPQATNPSFIVRMESEGSDNVYFYNNVVDIDNITGDGQSNHRAVGVIALVANSSSATNIQVKNNVIWSKSGGTESPFSNRIFYLGTGASVSSSNVEYNQVNGLAVGSVSGVTYSNNGTATPGFTATGIKPLPYYKPTTSGNLDQTGVNVGLPFNGTAPSRGRYEITD